MPLALRSLLNNPALAKDQVTFCAWHLAKSDAWSAAEIIIPLDYSDGSGIYWDFTSDVGYADYFCETYGWEEMPKAALEILHGAVVTEEAITALNPDADMRAVMDAVKQINKTASIQGI